jgi:hypothetical protein
MCVFPHRFCLLTTSSTKYGSDTLPNGVINYFYRATTANATLRRHLHQVHPEVYDTAQVSLNFLNSLWLMMMSGPPVTRPKLVLAYSAICVLHHPLQFTRICIRFRDSSTCVLLPYFHVTSSCFPRSSAPNNLLTFLRRLSLSVWFESSTMCESISLSTHT